MRFLLDECVGPAVAMWLRNDGRDAVSIQDVEPGAEDEAVLNRAATEKRILVTYDRDYGELVFLHRKKHAGVIYLRIGDPEDAAKISAIERVLSSPMGGVEGRFVVVTERTIRFASGEA